MGVHHHFFLRAAAAVAFGLVAATSIVATEASQAGTQAPFAAQPADAAVSVGVGFNAGWPRYYRYGWRNGVWVNLGFYNAPGPGWYPGVGWVGYAPPPHPWAWYVNLGYSPWYWHGYWYGGWHPWRHGYWGGWRPRSFRGSAYTGFRYFHR